MKNKSPPVTGYRIYRDGTHPSYILLPIIPHTPQENWVQPFEDSDTIDVAD